MYALDKVTQVKRCSELVPGDLVYSNMHIFICLSVTDTGTKQRQSGEMPRRRTTWLSWFGFSDVVFDIDQPFDAIV